MRTIIFISLFLSLNLQAAPQFGSVRVSKVISVYDGGLVF